MKDTLPLLLTRLRARLKVDKPEHKPAGSPEGGQFTSSGGGAGGGKEPSHLERLRTARQSHETARQAHEAARQEHQEARQAAYNGERDLAHAAYGRYSSAVEAAYDLHMHMESEGKDEEDGEAAAAYLRIENAAMALNDLVDISEGTVSERREQLEELRDGAKDMIAASDVLDEQKEQAREMRRLAKEALAGLRDYSKHRLAMRDIRSGESKAVLPVLLKRFQIRLKDRDAEGHEHKPEGPGGGQFTGHGGGGGGAGKKPRQVQRGPDTTYEGVPKDRANKLTAEESREALAYAEGMTTLVGSNGPNKRLPDATRPELDEYEQGALQKYSYLQDRILNRWLRKGECCAGSPYNETFFKEMHGLMQSAFDKAPVLEKPVQVMRGMKLDEAALHSLVSSIKEAGDRGEPISFQGYTSTAKPGGLLYKLGLVPGIPHAFQGNVSLTINAVHGLDVKPYSQLPAEEEFLLNHASQFKIKSMVRKKDGWHIELDQLPPAKHGGKGLTMMRQKGQEGSQDEAAALAAFYEKHPEAVNKWLDTDASFIDFGGGKDKAALPQLLKRLQDRLKSEDAAGHEHKPAGSSEGGQFTGSGSGGPSSDTMAGKPARPKKKPRSSVKKPVLEPTKSHEAVLKIDPGEKVEIEGKSVSRTQDGGGYTVWLDSPYGGKKPLDFPDSLTTAAFLDGKILGLRFHASATTGAAQFASEDVDYKGQDESWTERQTGEEVLKKPILGWHYGNESGKFMAKETCFYREFTRDYIRGPGHMVIIPPGTHVTYYDDEFRVELTEDMPIFKLKKGWNPYEPRLPKEGSDFVGHTRTSVRGTGTDPEKELSGKALEEFKRLQDRLEE